MFILHKKSNRKSCKKIAKWVQVRRPPPFPLCGWNFGIWNRLLAAITLPLALTRYSFQHLSLVVFAEGERSKNGYLGEFKRGPFLMAQKAKASIIPVSICGVGEAMPPGTFIPMFCSHITMRLHPSINTNGRELNDIIKETRDAVASGLEQRDYYSAVKMNGYKSR